MNSGYPLRIVKHVALSILALFLLATATFFMMKIIPGDPFAEEQTMLPETIAALHRLYGLDKPLLVQYKDYIISIFSLDLGPSLKHNSQSVNQIIRDGFPVSLILGLEALFIAIPLGILFGCLGAKFHKGWPNVCAVSLTVLGVSVPTFVIATGLQFLFAMYFPLFPVARWGTFWHTVLPAITLAVTPTCFIARLLRTSILEVIQQPYIQTARMKGLSEIRIFAVHVLKNAIFPVLAYLGPITTNVLVGSFVVEKVFGIPGLGQWFVNGVINRDYPVIAGLTLFYSTLLLINHALLDLIASSLQPPLSTQVQGGQR
jgi:oligopeptide transport system permease protein